MWDETRVCVKDVIKGVFSLIILLSFSNINDIWLTNVCGPTDCKERKHFFTELWDLYSLCDGSWCIGGDFNIIIWPSERSLGFLSQKDGRLPYQIPELLVRKESLPIISLFFWRRGILNGDLVRFVFLTLG